MIHPVILCGGSGTRLWPVSRRSYPKQFSQLIGEESLFERCVRRLSGPGYGSPIVLTNSEFRFIAAEQLSEADCRQARIVIEPEMRNTAPAILAAAMMLAETPEALMLVAPSDHVLPDQTAFDAAVRAGARAAESGQLVTFGIQPSRAETGYGWLELAEQAVPEAPQPALRFIEKPDLETAEKMLAEGRYLWNAGIFLFRVGDILAAGERSAPDLMAPCRAAVETGYEDLMFFRLGEAAYGEAAKISIDYAVMERADNLSVVPYGGDWSDLGAWDAVWRSLGPDDDGVVAQGAAQAFDCRDTLLRSDPDGPRLIGLGLEGLAAIAMRDAVLVTPLAGSQSVREAVDQLKAEGHLEAEEFPRCHRPWGWFESLARGPRFQVKQIMVKPGGELSLQSHLHRSEHWVVVAGTAEVTLGEDLHLLGENESIYIPLGAKHKLANRGKMALHLIEVQSGAYLGEDDITRYEDIYARK